MRRLAIDFIDAVSNGSLFEIGCGLYPLVNELGSRTNYVALEIDSFACAQLRAQGLDCCAQPSEIRYRLQSFDLVVALFVMQFHVPDETLQLLVSSTGLDTVFLFNVATKDPAIRHAVSSKLLEQGMWMHAIQAPTLGNDTIFVGAKRAGILRALHGAAAVQTGLQD
ncbi:hypothetical protein AAE026_11480 [Bradyrhizobium sp. DN5]|uniref:hypothetical protein n=1 Tax=Bradyrhizobium sp. DN5 TaxID=3056950 RepID=UPI003523385B